MKLEHDNNFFVLVRDEAQTVKGFHGWRIDEIRRLKDEGKLEPDGPMALFLEADERFNRCLDALKITR